MSQRKRVEGTRRIGALIPKSHARALEISAEENGRSIAAEIRLALQEWLRKQGRIAS